MKISIVIPTMTFDLLKSCVDSIIKYTDLNDMEIIIIANGASFYSKALFNDYVYIYLKNQNIEIIYRWYDKPLGAVPALNVGIREASGEYILLLNDDVQILQSEKNFWIESLIKPFDDPKVAVAGPFKMLPLMGKHGVLQLSQEDVDYGFIIFFMALIKKSMFDELGLLDEELNCGVDIDFCMKAKRKGYLIRQVPEEKLLTYSEDSSRLVGNFPVWHEAEATVHKIYGADEWSEIIEKDAKILEERYGMKDIKKKVSIIIPTHGNSLEFLKKSVESIISNTDQRLVEIIVVANGCDEVVRSYMSSYPYINLIWFDEPKGFPFAANEGVKASSGEYIIFFNHDAIVTSPSWVPLLLQGFTEDKVGITGPLKGDYPDIGRKFILFFCVCIRRKVFDDIGLIDMVFTPGGFEDIDFCCKAEDVGWELRQVPSEEKTYKDGVFTGNFPIYHEEHHRTWMSSDMFQKNRQVILDRYYPNCGIAEKLDIPRDVITTKTWPFIAQKKYEIVMVQEFLKNQKITKILEIGSHRGGTALLWAHLIAPIDGRVYCCDVDFNWGPIVHNGIQYERQVYNNTPYEKYIMEIKGDSHRPETIDRVKKETGGRVDVLFIDGDHSYEGVKQDFNNFFPLVKVGGSILFHDIIDSEYHRNFGCNVSLFWNDIKEKVEDFHEFIDNNAYEWPGGPVSRCMGIGAIRKTSTKNPIS